MDDPQTTNNRMELLAAIKGIKETPDNSEVLLYTDSKYVKDGITSWITKWKKSMGNKLKDSLKIKIYGSYSMS